MAVKVTKEWVQNYIDTQPKSKVVHMVGRALKVLLERQTQDEKLSNNTHEKNGRGFNKADSRSGCLSAKSYMKNGTLADWQVQQWTRLDANGYPRIAKYHRQLNEAAMAKEVFDKIRCM